MIVTCLNFSLCPVPRAVLFFHASFDMLRPRARRFRGAHGLPTLVLTWDTSSCGVTREGAVWVVPFDPRCMIFSCFGPSRRRCAFMVRGLNLACREAYQPVSCALGDVIGVSTLLPSKARRLGFQAIRPRKELYASTPSPCFCFPVFGLLRQSWVFDRQRVSIRADASSWFETALQHCLEKT